ASASALRLVSPCSKSLPTNVSMLAKSENAFVTVLCLPVIVHVTSVPFSAGTKVNSVTFDVLKGLMNSRSIVRLSLGMLSVMVIDPSPALLLPDHAYLAPLPEPAPEWVRCMFGSSFSHGDHSGHVWKSFR